MHFEALKKFHFILASKSPRRQYLLKELGLTFDVHTKDVDESFPSSLKAHEIPLYLAEKKANAFEAELSEETIVITSDTIVWIENQVLNKPADKEDAVRMLKLLSGKIHEVYTGVCLKSKHKIKSFYACTKVYFKPLTMQEIEYYITNFNPYDKAGAYGAQEWIGYIAVEKIEGSYFNVMGLPLKELYEQLLLF
ncbi:MAG TPA: Maf family nucleotide pyrophosphatase [Chitinophagales bacterium]|nr:Maf family nucleotide pyrophosphatase [Chitinophagales bacterium]